jgi:putative molybdopterin biosynthesis protein
MHHTIRGADDVRMRGFAHRHTVAAALAWLDAQLKPLADEIVPLRLAAGRVLATSVVSDVDVPGFDRATMDGYARRARDSHDDGKSGPLTHSHDAVGKHTHHSHD